MQTRRKIVNLSAPAMQGKYVLCGQVSKKKGRVTGYSDTSQYNVLVTLEANGEIVDWPIASLIIVGPNYN